MAYFSSHYSRINYPIANADHPRGLRNAQIGAIHSIAAHFTISNEPALVTMPTGSGKTAVLNLSAYVLQAKRVLVISSSVLVRGQIVDEFSTLKTLKNLNVFHADLAVPRINEIRSPIRSMEEWQQLAEYDVIIGIPNSINEGINENFRPALDFFDLILVDEAHHVPAFTWTNIIDSFPDSKKVFFTATPFRRDRKEIKGKLVFNYSIAKAYADGIFGEIGYYPVITDNPNTDLAIALETQRIFQKDRQDGLRHYLMVRTETKEESRELDQLYAQNTTLKLKRVDSSLTYTNIQRTIEKLKAGELDGIICVDMLGEGFDFPNLKIAALHSPKKSIANTLQFIGRFARTNAEHIGIAKFLAIPSDIEIGKKKLYAEGAIWNDIIKNLSDTIIGEQDEIKTVLETFEDESAPNDTEDISFYNLNPYCHVKVYSAEGLDLSKVLEIPTQRTLFHKVSAEYNAIVIITKEVGKPKWISTDDLVDVSHYLYFLFYDDESKLLFIHSSIKTNEFYDNLVELFAVGDYKRIAKYQINKVLVDISNPEFFNIGMQNRSANSGETYRIIAGSNAETTIRKSHGKNYANGHVFLKGVSGGENITVGYSSASKVWSNAYEKIPNFIKWCKVIGGKIVSEKEVKTNTGFDNLPIGIVVDKFPLPAHSAIWNHETFIEYPFILQLNEDEVISRDQLLDFSIEVKKELCTEERLAVDMVHADLAIPLIYDFEQHFQYRTEMAFDYVIESGEKEIDLIAYLNENPLHIYLHDFGAIINHEFFPPQGEGTYQYDPQNIESFDWDSLNTDITVEFYQNPGDKHNNGDRKSIHDAIAIRLANSGYPIIIYDHGTGEVADFITFKEYPDKIEICLYHVKGSSGPAPGDRVNDVYEVCMQAVKSQIWVKTKQVFKAKVLSRIRDNPGKFFSGDQNSFESLMNKNKMINYAFAIVQPGISQQSFTPKISFTLAATDDSIINSGFDKMIVWRS